jgi:hypothetical protein
MDFDDPFSTLVVITSEQTEAEIEAECKALVLRQKAIQSFSQALLQGSWHPGDISAFGDLLAETEVNPNEYADALTHNLNFIINHQLNIDTNGLDIFRSVNS